MSYIKTGLGTTYADRFNSVISQDSKDRAQGITITSEAAARAEADRAWVASLPACPRPDGSGGYLYVNRYGVQTCTADPIGDRANELRAALKIVPVLVATNPVGWKDGKWIPIKFASPPQINPLYVRMLLEAQGGNPAGERAADEARISYKLQKDGQPYAPTDRPLTPTELDEAFNKQMGQFSAGGSLYYLTSKAAESNEGGQALRAQLAYFAYAHSDIYKGKEIENGQDYDFCARTMGLPEAAIPCCMEFVASGQKPNFPHDSRYPVYRKLVEKQDSSVMACIRSAQENAARSASSGSLSTQTVMLVAGGAVAIVVVASLLKKGRKK